MTLPLICLPLFGVGMTEWIIIGLAILVFFGATKLPKLGQGLGEGIRNFKKGIKGELDEDGNPIVKADGAGSSKSDDGAQKSAPSEGGAPASLEDEKKGE